MKLMKFLVTVLLIMNTFSQSWMLLNYRLMRNIRKVCMKSVSRTMMKFMIYLA